MGFFFSQEKDSFFNRVVRASRVKVTGGHFASGEQCDGHCGSTCFAQAVLTSVRPQQDLATQILTPAKRLCESSKRTDGQTLSTFQGSRWDCRSDTEQ
ncbi:hypothetical protein SKAU_G00036250 [Synaphobranchus kaupii]|uniref:Uncharacterized protein n=1 Tax=Synaphobranchus kaupii TaxID=118154 RepID=A0A9Q1GH19_SYNKA|nr:hypothetical protein SKAU_G00036250 [Synaphobranchus kaupii]